MHRDMRHRVALAGLLLTFSACGPTRLGDSGPDETPYADDPATCHRWCSCLIDSCPAREEVERLQSCLESCEQVDFDSLNCWTRYCEMVPEAVGDPYLEDHFCEHAVGVHGLWECPPL